MSKEFLLSVTKKDLQVQTFRSGGPGGQHQNKVETGVRIIHKESGAIGESREEKSQWQNKKIALKRMTEHKLFKIWLNRKAYELKHQKTIDQIVDEQMKLELLKFEGKDDKERWITI